MPPLLSIIVPHHNHLHCLPRLLDSILAQSFKNLEVILVDDCSDESCGTVVDTYRNKGLDIVLLEHDERIYTMKARLEGIRAARGEIIGFADADDMLWGTEALEKNVEIFLRERPDILHFRTAIIDVDGRFKDYASTTDPWALSLQDSDIFRRHVSSPNFFASSSLWNKFFSREISLTVRKSIGRTSVLRYYEDGYMLILYTFYAKKYIGSRHVAYAYYHNEEKKYEQAHERAVHYYHALQELLPYLRARGCPDEDLSRYKDVLLECLCVSVGHMSLAARQREGTSISDEAVERLLEHTDAFTMIKALLLGNARNAEKILCCLKIVTGRRFVHYADFEKI
jgi:glycosyltransferase involved in cell wall biosynthesis